MYVACEPIERVNIIDDDVSIQYEHLQDAVQLEIGDIFRMMSDGFVFLSMTSTIGDLKRYMKLGLKPIVVLKRFSSLRKEYSEFICEKIEAPDKFKLF